MRFSDWLILREGGKGSGTKMSVTGHNAGGQAQGGMGMNKPAKPQTKLPPSPFSPSDTVPSGWKPQPGPGGSHGIWKPRQPGLSGAGKIPPKQIQGPFLGGKFGGGSPGSKKSSSQMNSK